MLWFSQPSQLWPQFREEEVVAKGSKYRRQDGGGAGVGKEPHRPGWDGMLPFIISGLKVTWGGFTEEIPVDLDTCNREGKENVSTGSDTGSCTSSSENS